LPFVVPSGSDYRLSHATRISWVNLPACPTD